MPPVEVDPAQLLVTGRTLSAIAVDLKGCHQRLEEMRPTAVGAANVTRALGGFADDWQFGARRMRDHVEFTGAALEEAAARYAGVEAALSRGLAGGTGG